MQSDNLQFDAQPTVSVGILSAEEIKVTLDRPYTDSTSGLASRGPQTFSAAPGGGVAWQGAVHPFVLLTPAEAEGCSFEVSDVVIGVGFHWERRENQRFSGELKIIREGDRITLVNILPVEDYLLSVISSEMSATASLELLKAHAVISRGWLLAQIVKNKEIAAAGSYEAAAAMTDNDELRLRWYDREDHSNFDVCADDHCQRYQGITRQSTPRVAEAIAATRGLALTADGRLCDTRFSKCCGGVFEEFENCWEPTHHSYLVARRDSTSPADFPDLRDEETAREWILGRPAAFCNTADKHILSQVLNNYDQETTDFYRWTVDYGQAELAALIRERSGIDFGAIRDLQPVERGTSGRLVRLRIVGTKRTMVIGKELEIRRTLSTSHLYSSAFVVDRGAPDADGLPAHFTLYGAGWGHGVGLCQIGAAVMGEQGYGFEAILAHYFPGSALTRLY